jgi:TrpR family trp operon transcriptional repressor
MKYEIKYGKELESLLIKISSDKKLLHEFLIDLLSPAEYKEFAVRLQIIKRLKSGQPHRKIAKELHVGVATVNRGAIELSNKSGGFELVLKKYYKKI